MDAGVQERLSAGCELIADVASNFGEVRLKVTGASMMPAVWPGDVVTVSRCDSAELKPGMIALYRRTGTIVVHRIVRLDGDAVITQGDSLPDEDLPAKQVDVLGRVVRIERNGRLINPKLSPWWSMCSAILRRSTFCLRMTLRVGRRIRRFGSKELSWSR